jgi:hypothetical protein
VVAAIQQLLVRLIVGANNSGFGSTFRVASYTQVTSLVNWIPIVGPLLALYGLYLSIVGIREMHNTTTGKAALVILIPFAVGLRKAAAKTKEALVEAIAQPLSAVTAQDVMGFFEHAGYRPVGHPP